MKKKYIQISKESIFSDLNNFQCWKILGKKYGEYFGFTQEEVDTLLKKYGLEEKRETVKEWYNGYLFGNTKIYNPWSIMKYLLEREEKAYWVKTSSNELIKNICSLNEKENIEIIEDGKKINGDTDNIYKVVVPNLEKKCI